MKYSHLLLALMLVCAACPTRANGLEVTSAPALVPKKQDSIMEWHTAGRRPKESVYSAQDRRRPLIGAHVYFEPPIKDILPNISDLFDFITQDDHHPWIPEELEAARMPWVELFHNAIPVGCWERSWEPFVDTGSRLYRIQQSHKYCLGFDTGSEPHFSPGYRYTGHTKEKIDSLIVSPKSSKEFGNWMAGLYGDSSPSQDSNGDGITFDKDFGFASDTWETLGSAMPEDSPFKVFLQTLFKEFLIANVIVRMDNYYHGIYSGKMVITSHLLSVPYSPTFGQSMRQLKLPSDAVGVTHYVFKSVGEKAPKRRAKLAVFDADVVEFAGSCIYQQAVRTGRRVFYNEFQCGSLQGNTPDNIYRAVFHELQFKPAAFNWFCFSVGKSWAWFNCRPIMTELAVLRGQLELMSPYRHIERPQRELAVFIPPANPDSTRDRKYADVEGNQWRILQRLAAGLTKHGPDVFLSEQLDKYDNYENLVIVLGYTDGPTDIYLTKFLQDVPADKRVLVLCSKTQLFCEPGHRASRDFTHGLMDVLPVSPMGGPATAVSLKVGEAKEIELSVPRKVRRNANIGDGNWLVAEGQTVGWRCDNLMVLAGIPTSGCGVLVESFFGLPEPIMRSAGALHILNSDAIAKTPGYYCLEKGQTLTISEKLSGYDLPRRKPVKGVVSEPGVVWVLDSSELHVVDAGTANIRVLSNTKDHMRLQVSIPHYEFPKPVKPELIIASPAAPSVTVGDKPLPVEPIGDTCFYLSNPSEDGECTVTK